MFQKINPDDGFHTTAICIGKEHQDRHQDIDIERHAERGKDHELQGDADEVEPDGRAQHLGNEEEPCACAVRGDAEAVFQIAVDGDQVHLVEKRHQHEGYDQLSGNESECHLHIAESGCRDHARHGNERHA